MRWVREVTPRPDVARLYRSALVLTLSGNLLLAVSKGIAAYLSGSVALYADAANSVSDIIYSLLMVLGLWVALRPPDMSHPQGHSRFEPLVGLMVTISMGVAGYEAASQSIMRFIEGGRAVELGWPAAVLLFSAAVKVAMFFYIRRIASKLSSPTLATTAQDNITDVFSSLAAFIGALGSRYISPLTDPIAGILVSLWILRAALWAGKENLGFLTGAGASEELRHQMVDVAESIPGVQRVHHMMTEYVGPRLVVDMHINVNGSLSVEEAHQIEDAVVKRVEELPEVDRAYVHIEPEGHD